MAWALKVTSNGIVEGDNGKGLKRTYSGNGIPQSAYASGDEIIVMTKEGHTNVFDAFTGSRIRSMY